MASERELIQRLEGIISELTGANPLRAMRRPYYADDPNFLGWGVPSWPPAGYRSLPKGPSAPSFPGLTMSGRDPYGRPTQIDALAAFQPDPVEESVEQLRFDVGEMQLAISDAAVFADIAMRRIIQCSIYVEDDAPNTIVSTNEALVALYSALDCEIYARATPQIGSWLERWLGRTKDLVTNDAVVQRLEKIERAAELKGLDNPQADADLKAAQAISVLMKAMKDSENAVALAGSVCVLKKDGAVFCFTLSQEQLTEVRKNPLWLKRPDIFEKFFLQSKGEEEPKLDAPPRRIVVKKRRKDSEN